MPDAHFAQPRLARIYDDVDDDRSDLDLYEQLIDEHGAQSVLDVGCGTGTLACRLAQRGLTVVGVDPAGASLDVARRKPFADRVRWIHGTTAELPPLEVDMATMTGNVAQVFLGDGEWARTLTDIRAALGQHGVLIFESRVPSRRAWEQWTPEATRRTVNIAGVGTVEYTVSLLDVSLPFVRFRSSYHFANDDRVLVSDSTLRFRDLEELRGSLHSAGFRLAEVRDAPDRPGCEYVVVATTDRPKSGLGRRVAGPAG